VRRFCPRAKDGVAVVLVLVVGILLVGCSKGTARSDGGMSTQELCAAERQAFNDMAERTIDDAQYKKRIQDLWQTAGQHETHAQVNEAFHEILAGVNGEGGAIALTGHLKMATACGG
jgi:hypothetical protein